jgi:hypothetical protein
VSGLHVHGGVALPERSGVDGRPGLASLDSLGDPDELRTRAEQLLRAGETDGRPPATQEGADASDSVWLSLDARGGLAGVEISRHWRDRIGPAGFAPALYEAYVDATRKVLTAAGLARLAGTAAPTPTPAPDDSGAAPVRDGDWLSATWAALDEVETELDRLSRLDSTAAAAMAQRTVPGPDGLLEVRVRGGNVVGISGNATRIAGADVDRLRQEAVAVLRAAAHRVTSDNGPGR